MSDPTPIEVPRFWRWLLKPDRDGSRGLANIVNRWLGFHLVVAFTLAALLHAESAEVAKALALPGASALIGLAFGWAGRSASLLQDKEFSKFIIEDGAPPEGYVYSFQLAVLVVLMFIATALVMASVGLPISIGTNDVDEFGNRAWLFFIGSVAVREAWGTVDFVNKLTIQFYRKRQLDLALEEEKAQ